MDRRLGDFEIIYQVNGLLLDASFESPRTKKGESLWTVGWECSRGSGLSLDASSHSPRVKKGASCTQGVWGLLRQGVKEADQQLKVFRN